MYMYINVYTYIYIYIYLSTAQLSIYLQLSVAAATVSNIKAASQTILQKSPVYTFPQLSPQSPHKIPTNLPKRENH